MISSNSKCGGKVIRVDMSGIVTPPREDADAIADMHMLAVMEQLATLQAAGVDGRFTDAAKKIIKSVKDGASAAVKAAKDANEKYEKWKAARDKAAHDKAAHDKAAHDKAARDKTAPDGTVPTAVIPAAQVHQPSPIIVQFPEKYAERMDKYIEILTKLLDMILQIIASNQESADTPPDTPDGAETDPQTAQSNNAQGGFYIIAK